MNSDKQGFFRDMKQLGEEYVNERINLAKLQAAEKAARMSAVFAVGLVLSILLFFVLLFLSLLAAFALYDATGNVYTALGVVAGFFALVASIIFLTRKNSLYPAVTNAVIKMLFEKTSDETAKP
jgi:uncharacterized membrane protein YqjE